jgi:transposase-like protein
MTNPLALTIPGLAEAIPDEATAYKVLEDLRWPEGPVCPHCGTDRKPYFLTPKNGTTRATGKLRTMSPRRVWKCAKCRKQFSVLTNTIFHGTKIPIRTWLFAIVEMCASKNGVAARELERKYGLTPKTAWFMAHRIREAMASRAPWMLVGTIEADETWMGGVNRVDVPADVPKIDRYKYISDHKMDNKTPVVSLLNTTTGEVRSRVVPDVTGATLAAVIRKNISTFDSVLHTDENYGYKQVGREFIAHESVNHSEDEYVRGNVTTNHIEAFFGQLKRSVDGTHHHVSREHLDRYLAEFDFRHSTRKMSDAQRVQRLMGQTGGRRLAYRPLTNGA